MSQILVIGYGNPSRQDDGVGHYVADRVEYLSNNKIDKILCHQLGIELAETIKDYDLVIFVDAHVGDRSTDIEITHLESLYSVFAFTHSVKPSLLIALTESLYQKKPKAFLVSINGYNFDFGTELSPETQKLADIAAGRILELINQ